MLKILIFLRFHWMTFFVCFDFYNYSFSFTVELSLSRRWASKEEDCLINHCSSPPPPFKDLSLICLPPAATEFFPIHLSYLLFISFCELGNGLIKLVKTLLKTRLSSETVSEIFSLARWLPDLNTASTFLQAFWIVEVATLMNVLVFRQFESTG